MMGVDPNPVNTGWDAPKTTFANGRLCKAMGVDSCRLMLVFCEDKKLFNDAHEGYDGSAW